MRKLLLATALIPMLIATSVFAQQFGDGDRREMFKQKMQERLQQVDTNGDGMISKAEFMAQAESRFAKMDTNGDGRITQEERAGMRDKFQQMREGRGFGGGLGGEQFP